MEIKSITDHIISVSFGDFKAIITSIDPIDESDMQKVILDELAVYRRWASFCYEKCKSIGDIMETQGIDDIPDNFIIEHKIFGDVIVKTLPFTMTLRSCNRNQTWSFETNDDPNEKQFIIKPFGDEDGLKSLKAYEGVRIIEKIFKRRMDEVDSLRLD